MTRSDERNDVHVPRRGRERARHGPAVGGLERRDAQKANQTITVTTHAPASAVFGTSFTVAATAPGGAVTFSSSGACSNSGATFTMTSGTGTCSVKYDQAGQRDLQPGAAGRGVGDRAEGRPDDHGLDACAARRRRSARASRLRRPRRAARSRSRARARARTRAATFTMTSGTGTCMCSTTRPGSANYNPAPQVVETVNAQKATQSITVTTHAPATRGVRHELRGGGERARRRWSRSRARGACSNSGSTFTMTSGTGTCSVRYDQAGDANYTAGVAGRRVGDRAEGGADDHRDDACAGDGGVRHELRRRGDGAGRCRVVFSSAGVCSNSARPSR